MKSLSFLKASLHSQPLLFEGQKQNCRAEPTQDMGSGKKARANGYMKVFQRNNKTI